MTSRSPLLALAAVALASALSNQVSAAEGPIRIGNVSSLSGPMSLPESTMAAKAVFDRVNASGGIQGRQIEYIVQDDKGDAGATAQAARELVDAKGVVAFAGSASLQDCTVNGNLYRQRGVLSIPGVGGEFSCYRNGVFAPVSVGPARGTLATLVFAAKQLKKEKICAFLLGIPAHGAGNTWAIDNYTKLAGKPPHLVDMTVLPNDDMTPHVLKAKKAGCDAIIFSGAEQMDLAWVKAMKSQRMDDVTLVLMTPAYTTNFANILGKAGDGIYANSEYEPFLSDSPALTDWRKLMADAKVPESSFAQGGYLSASFLVDALKRIKGPITRDTVTAELRKTKGAAALKHPMMGLPFAFPESVEVLNTSATKFVRLSDGKWQTVTPEFVVTMAKK